MAPPTHSVCCPPSVLHVVHARGPSSASEYCPPGHLRHACCDALGATCPPGGIPTTCDGACAQILLPMQERCLDFLKTIGMADAVNAAAATCPLPAEPCTNFPEFTTYNMHMVVTAACCDAPGAVCVGGLPTTCTPGCGEVLVPMQRACADFLAMIGMADTVGAAVASCGSSH